jgi:hypothetical protein
MRSSTVAACLALLVAAPLGAQEFLDRGVFIVTRAGAEMAREEFAITRVTGRDEGLRAVSTVRGGGREVQHAIEVAADHAPLSFQQIESAGGTIQRRVAAQITGGRVAVRVAAAEGESAREFPVRAPLVILGDDQASAFRFVPRPTGAASRPVFVVRPTSLRPAAATVEAQGDDTVSVGGQVLTARRYVLRIEGGDERRFWFTPDGDLVRVARPADGTVATRAELPRR